MPEEWRKRYAAEVLRLPAVRAHFDPVSKQARRWAWPSDEWKLFSPKRSESESQSATTKMSILPCGYDTRNTLFKYRIIHCDTAWASRFIMKMNDRYNSKC